MSDDFIDTEPESVRFKKSLFEKYKGMLDDPQTGELVKEFCDDTDYDFVVRIARKALSGTKMIKMEALHQTEERLKRIKKLVDDLKLKERAKAAVRNDPQNSNDPVEIIDLDSDNDEVQEIIEISVDDDRITNRVPNKFFPYEHPKWFPRKFERQKKRTSSPMEPSTSKRSSVEGHNSRHYNEASTSSNQRMHVQNSHQNQSFQRTSNQQMHAQNSNQHQNFPHSSNDPRQNVQREAREPQGIAARRNSVYTDKINNMTANVNPTNDAPSQNPNSAWAQNNAIQQLPQQMQQGLFLDPNQQQLQPLIIQNPGQMTYALVPIPVAAPYFQPPPPNTAMQPPLVRAPPPRSMSFYSERPNQNFQTSNQIRHQAGHGYGRNNFNAPTYAEHKKQRELAEQQRRERAANERISIEKNKSRWGPSTSNSSINTNVDPRRPQITSAAVSNAINSAKQQTPPNKNNSNLQRAASSGVKPVQNTAQPSGVKSTQSPVSSKPVKNPDLNPSKYGGSISSAKPMQSVPKSPNTQSTNVQPSSSMQQMTQPKEAQAKSSASTSGTQNMTKSSNNQSTNAQQSSSRAPVTQQKNLPSQSQAQKDKQQNSRPEQVNKSSNIKSAQTKPAQNSPAPSNSSVRTQTTIDIQNNAVPSTSNESTEKRNQNPSTSIKTETEIKTEIVEEDDQDEMDDDINTANSDYSESDEEKEPEPETMDFEEPQQENLATEAAPQQNPISADFIPMRIKLETFDPPELPPNPRIEIETNENEEKEIKVKVELKQPGYDGDASTEVEDNEENLNDSESSSGSEHSTGINGLINSLAAENEFLAEVGRLIPNSQKPDDEGNIGDVKVKQWLVTQPSNISPPASPCYDFPMTNTNHGDEENWEFPEELEEDLIIPLEPAIKPPEIPIEKKKNKKKK